jgi:hypothetical protein
MPYLHDFVDIFHKMWNPHKNLYDLLTETSDVLGLSLDIAFCLFGRATWLRWLPVDLDAPIDHFMPVNIIWS